MTTIPATLVKELRDATNLGMMECKRALVETKGDKDLAIKILRERGMAIAEKKASRSANEGRIAAKISADGKTGTMFEVNCETDFVAKNDNFQNFVDALTDQAIAVGDGELADAVKDEMIAKIAEIGENLVIRRNVRYEAQGTGSIASYIHLGAKVGVLVEIGCEKEDTPQQGVYKELVKDITLHIAATSPQHLHRDHVPEEVVSAERAIYAKQMEGKPENIIDKIVTGKLDKFFSQICLVEQGFVKEPDRSVSELVAATGKTLGDTLAIRRFIRYQVGQA